jgi:hypothetical protein
MAGLVSRRPKIHARTRKRDSGGPGDSGGCGALTGLIVRRFES